MTIQATKKLKTATKKILTNTNKKLASQLLDVFIEKIPADDLSRVSPENLAYTVDCHIELSQVRPSNDIGINIYTPNIKKHGWDDKRTIIDIVNDDMAFLVDSVVAEVIRQNYEITVFIHPITHVSMDTKKKPKSFSVAPTDKTHAQSHIHIELSKTISKEQCEELEMGLRNVLRDARYANTDWLAIREKLTDAKDVLTSSPKRFAKQYISECQSFLDYLYNDNFTLLGYREYKITKKDDGVKSSVVKGSSL